MLDTSAAGATPDRHVHEKRPRSEVEAARNAREAELLELARHPGVVELVGLQGESHRPVLVTVAIQGCALDAARPLEAEEVAGVVAGVAATLADLHDLGVVHGAVAPAHVIVGSHGHPSLCGFGYGGRVGEVPLGEPSVPPEFVDPARQPHHPLHPSTDVFGVGALIAFLLAPACSGSDGASRFFGRPSGAGAIEILRELAGATRAPSPDDRPTARSIAATIYESVPQARLPRPPLVRAPQPGFGQPESPGPRLRDAPLEDWRRQLAAPVTKRLSPPRVRNRWRATAIVASAVVLTVGGVASMMRIAGTPPSSEVTDRRLPAGPAIEPEPASPPATTADSPATTAHSLATTAHSPATEGEPAPARRPPVRTSCAPTVSTLEADIDGDGCPEALSFTAGVITANDTRWAVGQAGDQVAVGDWFCRGDRTLALLRPSTGQVFRFDRWASPGADVFAAPEATVENAVAVRAADLDHDGCHELVVDVESGTPQVIDTP